MPEYKRLLDLEANLKAALKAKKAIIKAMKERAKKNNVKVDPLEYHKNKVIQLAIERDLRQVQLNIVNALNPKKIKPDKSDENKLSVTNLSKLSVSNRYDKVVY